MRKRRREKMRNESDQCGRDCQTDGDEAGRGLEPQVKKKKEIFRLISHFWAYGCIINVIYYKHVTDFMFETLDMFIRGHKSYLISEDDDTRWNEAQLHWGSAPAEVRLRDVCRRSSSKEKYALIRGESRLSAHALDWILMVSRGRITVICRCVQSAPTLLLFSAN